jgi:Ca-activated chloride channel family protein
MTWARPEAFWLLALVPVLFGLFLHHERRSGRLLRELVAERLQPELAGSVSRGRRRLRLVLLLLGLAAAIVALAQPRYGFIVEEHKGFGRDIIIAIDTSKSMMANDLSPSRLGRAKLAVEDLVRQLHGDRVGLVAFAGSAFLQAPLTVDYAEVLNTLRDMDTNMIPVGGTNIAEAIESSVQAFGGGESDHRALIIFSDGEELDADGVKAARDAAKTAKIFTIGCGTASGTLLQIRDEHGRTEYVKGPDGQIVKSSLDEARLRAIAEATGGFYTLLQNGPPEMQRLIRDGLDRLKLDEMEALQQRTPIERYHWPLAAGLVLLIGSLFPGERRRRLPPAAATLALLLLCAPAHAKNRGLEAYDRQEYGEARREFQEQVDREPNSAPLQYNLGAAAFKEGQYDKAVDAFSKAIISDDPLLRGKAEYNLGNSLLERSRAELNNKDAAIQDLENAQQHYDEALKVVPDKADAEHNRKLAGQYIAMLRLQKKEEQQKKEQKEGGDQKQQQKGKMEKRDVLKRDPNGDKRIQEENEEGGEKNDQQSQDGKDGQQSFKRDKDGKTLLEEEQKKPGEGDEKMAQEKEGKEGEEKDAAGKAGDQKEEAKKQGQITDANKDAAEQLRREQAARSEQEGREAQEEALAAAEGKMTESQAKALLESVRSQDQRVRLWNPKAQARPRSVVRDW